MAAEKKKMRIGLGTFDLIKGIAIFNVVFTHSLPRYVVEDFAILSPLFIFERALHSGLMPMFLIIMGFGFKKKTGMQMLKKSFSELIVPFFLAILSATILFFILHWSVFYDKYQLLKRTGEELIDFLLLTEKIVSLWFFIASFMAENLLNLIVKVKKTSIQIVLVGLCVALGFVFLQIDFTHFRIVQGLTAVGFCYVGYILKEKHLLEKWVHSIWTYLILIPLWLIQFLNSGYGGQGLGTPLLPFLRSDMYFEMAAGGFSFLIYFLAGCSGLLFVFIGVLCNRLEWPGMKMIRKFGMYSYWILITHSIELLAFPWYELWIASPNIHCAFVIEFGIKILFITMGCEIIKKSTEIRYKKRMEKNAKIRNYERIGSKVCQ